MGCRPLILFVRAGLALCDLACGTRIAHTTEFPADDASLEGGGTPSGDSETSRTRDSEPPRCAATLVERLTVTQVNVDEDVRYKQRGYNSVREDRRIAFAVQPNGASLVGWLDDGLTRVHVTPLSAGLTRSGIDTAVSGVDLGGLIAHDDGFALLTRREDPGEQLVDPNTGVVAKAAFLVRVRGGLEVFAVPLTGTAAITDYPTERRRDCAEPALASQLAFNGSKYGAYFTVHGCQGDWAEGNYGDKLVYVDANGTYMPGGWDWNCSTNEGTALLPEPDVFTSVCLSDGNPHPGLNLVVANKPVMQLAAEETSDGYCAGQLGSLIRTGGGYLIGWLSRGALSGTSRGTVRAAKSAPDIALLRLGPDYAPERTLSWLFETRDIAEANLHLAPYGPDRVLVVWDSIDNPRCSSGTCLGRYSGTHARLMDLNGRFLTPDALIDAPPNGDEDIAVFPNGDVGWAFVAEDPRSYSTRLPVDETDRPDVPAKRQISIARLRYCSD